MNKLFNPQKIALIGATDRENSVGEGIMKNLLQGEKEVFPVNPFKEEVLGKKTYSRILDIEEEIDLAIIAIPAEKVKEAAIDCKEKGVGAVIIISAGFKETGEEGKKREEEIKEILEGIPLLGPNCLGVIRPSKGLNASFAPVSPKAGKIALISQSGALIDSILSSSEEENYGFSVVISLGNAAGLGLEDFIKWASEDEETKVISLYIEGVEKGRDFFKALKESKKPIVVLKGGKSEKGREAVGLHTGSLAGEGKIFSGVLRQTRVKEVSSLEELFDLSKTLAWQSPFRGGVGIVTNGGGAGVLMTDYLEGISLPRGEFENPLDVLGDASPEKYREALEKVFSEEKIGVVTVILTLQIITDPEGVAREIVEIREKYQKPVVTVFMGGGEKINKAVSFLEEKGIPNFKDPFRAAKVLKALNQGL